MRGRPAEGPVSVGRPLAAHRRPQERGHRIPQRRGRAVRGQGLRPRPDEIHRALRRRPALQLAPDVHRRRGAQGHLRRHRRRWGRQRGRPRLRHDPRLPAADRARLHPQQPAGRRQRLDRRRSVDAAPQPPRQRLRPGRRLLGAQRQDRRRRPQTGAGRGRERHLHAGRQGAEGRLRRLWLLPPDGRARQDRAGRVRLWRQASAQLPGVDAGRAPADAPRLAPEGAGPAGNLLGRDVEGPRVAVRPRLRRAGRRPRAQKSAA